MYGYVTASCILSMNLQVRAERLQQGLFVGTEECFKGSARVKISSICLPNDQPRAVDQRNVQRLKEIFRREGCLPNNPLHHVPVLVSISDLENSLQQAQVKLEDLRSQYNPPTLVFGSKILECLHGKHRLLAGDDYLAPKDKYWVVDLYVNADSNAELIEYIRYEYLNSSNISDGEIFRHIRLCNKLGKNMEERRWWSRLTNSKRKDVEQLLRKSDLCEGFDRLLDMPGLWAGLKLGALHRLLTLKCDEVSCHKHLV